MRASRCGIVNFWSTEDDYLETRTEKYGTPEGGKGQAAGRIGFRVPPGCDPRGGDYMKLKQIKYQDQMGGNGGHHSFTRKYFLKKMVMVQFTPICDPSLLAGHGPGPGCLQGGPGGPGCMPATPGPGIMLPPGAPPVAPPPVTPTPLEGPPIPPIQSVPTTPAPTIPTPMPAPAPTTPPYPTSPMIRTNPVPQVVPVSQDAPSVRQAPRRTKD
jgi:hypothetical protein